MTTLNLNLGDRSYGISVGDGILSEAGRLMNLNRKVFILTDDGVPAEYAERIKAQAKEATVYTVKQGESSKSIETYGQVLLAMMNFDMSRGDCAVAVGGGVVGDLMGFCAASYMRGIDFYNIPTTLLSQVDSSIGGKTAINLGGIKNIVGAFYQPKHVLIDISTLRTLPKRQVSAGLAEAIKMSITSDPELFRLFEEEEINESNIETVIIRSLMIKKSVVENDEKEAGLRKILNFGHTFGHGVEAEEEMKGLYHGECVAIGMIPMCAERVKERLLPILKRLDLPTEYTGNIDRALSHVIHDKKCRGGFVEAVYASDIGKFEIQKITVDGFSKLVKERLK
jgi:3-dehydroquinate synthase